VTVPGTVVEAARRLGVDAGELRALPGGTGQTWAAGTGIIRLVHSRLVGAELAAMAAAGTAVPVPAVLDRADLDGTVALLMARLPGVPAADLTGLDVAGARRRGLACGRLYGALAAVPAPKEVPRADAPVPGDTGCCIWICTRSTCWWTGTAR
jgi:phosphotransferase family enzyme